MSKGKKSAYDLAVDALTKYSRERPDASGLWGTIITAKERLRDDSSFALVISSALERSLELALLTHFTIPKDAAETLFSDEFNGAISNLAAKIKLAYALGIYDIPVRDELTLIRHIRNNFAHAKEHLDFTSQIIADACKHLWLPDRWYSASDGAPSADSRQRFHLSCSFIFLYLDNPKPVGEPKKFKDNAEYASFFCTALPSLPIKLKAPIFPPPPGHSGQRY